MPLIEQALQIEQLQVGQELTRFTKPKVTKVQLVKYAGASGDFNPLHTDDAFAQKIGMPGVIAHGMLVMGFLGEYVSELAQDQLTIKQFSMRFGAMTFPGDEITCGGTVQDISQDQITLALQAIKQDGTVVGTGKVILAK